MFSFLSLNSVPRVGIVWLVNYPLSILKSSAVLPTRESPINMNLSLLIIDLKMIIKIGYLLNIYYATFKSDIIDYNIFFLIL